MSAYNKRRVEYRLRQLQTRASDTVASAPRVLATELEETLKALVVAVLVDDLERRLVSVQVVCIYPERVAVIEHDLGEVLLILQVV